MGFGRGLRKGAQRGGSQLIPGSAQGGPDTHIYIRIQPAIRHGSGNKSEVPLMQAEAPDSRLERWMKLRKIGSTAFSRDRKRRYEAGARTRLTADRNRGTVVGKADCLVQALDVGSCARIHMNGGDGRMQRLNSLGKLDANPGSRTAQQNGAALKDRPQRCFQSARNLAGEVFLLWNRRQNKAAPRPEASRQPGNFGAFRRGVPVFQSIQPLHLKMPGIGRIGPQDARLAKPSLIVAQAPVLFAKLRGKQGRLRIDLKEKAVAREIEIG